MKKMIATGFVVMGAVIFLGGCADEQNDIAQLQDIVESNEVTLPERQSDINGTISSIDGNVIIVKNEIGKEVLTEEEQAKKKEERQKMTQEERQALRVQETANLETKDETIELPAGTLIMKGSGNGDGLSVKAVFDDLKEGSYVSVWKNGDNVEAVKIKGL